MRLVDLMEHRPAYFYHGATMFNLMSILKDDSLNKGVHWGRDGEPDGVRVSRDINVGKTFMNVDGEVPGGILVLDQQILRHNHKIIPYSDVDAGGNPWGQSESEEVIITEAIKPLSRYLVKFICPDNHIKMAEQDIAEGYGNDALGSIEEQIELLYKVSLHDKRVNTISG